MKKIKCIETDMIYESARQAGQSLNISYKTISKCINGKAKSAGGYHFIAISESDLLPQATNQTSDISQKSPCDKSDKKVADMKKSPTQKVADNISDLLEKSPQEKSPMVTHGDTSTSGLVNAVNGNTMNESFTVSGNTNTHDWFTAELEAENSATKTSVTDTDLKTEISAFKTNVDLAVENSATKKAVDTELIESIITPATAEITPLIDKDTLISKWERNQIEQQLHKYIQSPIPLEFKESLVIAFYAYVKQYSSPFIDRIKTLENENQSLQQKNESLITQLAEHKSQKEALEYLTKEYDRVITPKEGVDMVQVYKDQRDTITRLSKEKYVLNCQVKQLQDKLDNTTEFSVEYERDSLLKKVAELNQQLAEYQDKTLDSMDKTLDKIVDSTEPKNGFSDSATLRRPTDSPLSDADSPLSQEQIKSSIKRINSREESNQPEKTINEITWDDI